MVEHNYLKTDHIYAANEMQSSVSGSWDHLCDSISLMCKWK